jgi:hypothetical protein
MQSVLNEATPLVDLATRESSPGLALSRAPLFAAGIHLILAHLVAALTVWRSSSREALRPELAGPARYLIAPLVLWDSSWFERIARDGYGAREELAAFWPALPAAARVLSSLSGVSIASSGLLLSHAAFVVALVLLYRLVAIDHGEEVAARTVWLLALSPVAFFFSAFYSEAVFLCTSVAAILFGRRGHWTGAAVMLFVVSLTRSVGVLVLLPLTAMLIAQHGWRWERFWRPGLTLAAGAAGPLAFALHLQRLWHDPLLMVHAQTYWHRSFAWPWQTLWHGFRRTELTYVMGRRTCFDAIARGSLSDCQRTLGLQIDSLSDDLALASAVVAIALLPIVIRRLAAPEAIYAAALLAFPLFSTTVDNPLLSFPRFMLVVYPLFVALAIVLKRREHFIATLAIETAGFCFLLSVFARAYFVA